MIETSDEDPAPRTVGPLRNSTPQKPTQRRTTRDQNQKLKSEIEKSGPKSETEIEDRAPFKRRSGRRPKTALTDQIEQAYHQLHSLDWLQDSELVNLPEVQRGMNSRHTMPEAQALRSLLFRAAKQVIQELTTVPDKSGVRVFLERHLEGRNLTEIARELKVSREWVSRAYRKEAFRLAGMQFVRSVSSDSQGGSMSEKVTGVSIQFPEQ